MTNLIWAILTWAPPDIWADPPQFVQSWQESILLWFGAQVTGAVQLVGNLLLSFPIHFLQTPHFHSIYTLLAVFALVLLPGLLTYRFIRAVLGESRWAFANQQDIVLFVVRFLAVSAIVFQAPGIFIVFARIANSVVKGLLGTAQLTLISDALPSGMGVELALIMLLVWVLIYALRVITYYAVRNIHLIVLLLSTPAVLVRWVLSGESEQVEQWLNQFIGLLIIQVAHALLLVVLTHLVNAGPPPEASSELAKLWVIMAQIGVMELMLRTQHLLSHVIRFQTIDEQLHITNAYKQVTSRLRRVAS